MPVVWLVAGSSGNPGHTGHVKMFLEAKKFIESIFGIKVQKGFFVLAQQNHVNSKDKFALSFEERRNIFNAECEDLKINDWLCASDYPHSICIEYAKEQKPDESVIIIEVVGADQIRKRTDGIPRIFFNRADAFEKLSSNDKTKFLLDEKDNIDEIHGIWKSKELSPNKIFRNWYFVNVNLGNSSSSLIRETFNSKSSMCDFVSSVVDMNGNEATASVPDRDVLLAQNTSLMTKRSAEMFWEFRTAKIKSITTRERDSERDQLHYDICVLASTLRKCNETK